MWPYSTQLALALTLLSSVAIAAEEPSKTPPAPSPTASSPSATEKTESTVVVHTDSPRSVVERKVNTSAYSGLPLPDTSFGSFSQWEQVCVAPCERPLDRRHSYRVTGEGLVPSETFTLPDRDRVVVEAKMGSSYGRLAGIGLTLAGATGVLLGSAASITSPILESQDAGSPALRTGLLAGGIGVLSAGLISAGVGVFLWATNATTLRPTTAASSNVRLTPSGFAF